MQYLDERDVFQKFYTKFLAKRLVQAQAVAEDGEALMLSKLKVPPLLLPFNLPSSSPSTSPSTSPPPPYIVRPRTLPSMLLPPPPLCC